MNRVAAALAAAPIASPCLAADETTDEDEALIEEIVVTATFRETNLMDTPISITVLDENSLEDKGIFDVRDMYLAVPSAP